MHEGYYIGSVVLYGLWVTPLIILWAMSLCLARGKGDPARTGFAWMKAVFPIYIVSLIFLTVGQIIIVYLIYGDSSIGSTLFRDLDNAGNHLQSVGSFLLSVADILLLVTFAELASGFLLCVKGKPLAKPARISILASAGLLFILSIVMVGLSSKAITASYDYLKTSSRNRTSAMRAARDRDILNANRMIGAFAVLLWIASLPILGLISWVVHEVRNARHLRNSIGLLLACGILNFIRMTTELALAATYPLSTNPPVLEDWVYTILVPILNFIPMFVILVMLFTMGIRKTKGLWSTGIHSVSPPPPTGALPGVAPYPYPAPVWQGPPPQGLPQGYYGAPAPMAMAPGQGGGPAPAYGYPFTPAYGGNPGAPQQPGQEGQQPQQGQAVPPQAGQLPHGYYPPQAPSPQQQQQQAVPPSQGQNGQLHGAQELKSEPARGT